jgi:hypothetical protein
MINPERLANSEDWFTRCVVLTHSSCPPELKQAIRDLHFLGNMLKIKRIIEWYMI